MSVDERKNSSFDGVRKQGTMRCVIFDPNLTVGHQQYALVNVPKHLARPLEDEVRRLAKLHPSTKWDPQDPWSCALSTAFYNLSGDANIFLAPFGFLDMIRPIISPVTKMEVGMRNHPAVQWVARFQRFQDEGYTWQGAVSKAGKAVAR